MIASARLADALNRCVVFDLDGTLVDTAPTLGWAINSALRDFGLPVLDDDAVRNCIGGGLDRFVASALLVAAGGEVDEAIEAHVRSKFRIRLEADPCHGATPRLGAEHLLTELRGDGAAIGVRTNKAARWPRRCSPVWGFASGSTRWWGERRVCHQSPPLIRSCCACDARTARRIRRC